MAVLRTVLCFGRNFSTVCGYSNKKLAIPKFAVMTWTMQIKSISSMEITKNMSLITNEKKQKAGHLKLKVHDDKPLVVMLSWLMAKKKHIYKYATFYVNNGFDVLNINISPWQLLWPTKGTQMVAADILKFLYINEKYGPLVLHGFSVGGYLWSEVMVHMATERDKYQHIIDKVIGQIWDSAADITEISIGMPIAVFPRNVVMQNALRQYILYHMKTFHKVATCHYVRASQMFHTNIVKAPALYFVSKSDPIGAVRSNHRARENWENMGIEVYWKCFEDSPHVGHMQKYPQEYIKELNDFLVKIGGVAVPKKVQAKL